MLPFAIRNVRHALIVGSGHGLGLALARAVLAAAPDARVIATYREPAKASGLLELASDSPLRALLIDPLAAGTFEQLGAELDQAPELDLVINAAGFLHDEKWQPERTLAAVNLAQLHHTFAVNAFLTPLLAQAVKAKLTRERPSAFVALSAKVGSIGDNRLGGWHSYRASKAALNMFIKNIALEFSHSGLRHCRVLAIHPGTTATELSAPFVRTVKHKVWSPEESARHVLATIESASAEGTGLFKNWDGTTLPW